MRDVIAGFVAAVNAVARIAARTERARREAEMAEATYRIGNHNPRNLYRVNPDGSETHVGCVFDEAFGPVAVAALNAPVSTEDADLREHIAGAIHRSLCSACNPDAGTGLRIRNSDADKAADAALSVVRPRLAAKDALLADVVDALGAEGYRDAADLRERAAHARFARVHIDGWITHAKAAEQAMTAARAEVERLKAAAPVYVERDREMVHPLLAEVWDRNAEVDRLRSELEAQTRALHSVLDVEDPDTQPDTGDWKPGDWVEYNAYGRRFDTVLIRPDGGACWKAVVVSGAGQMVDSPEPLRIGDEVGVVYGHSKKIESRPGYRTYEPGFEPKPLAETAAPAVPVQAEPEQQWCVWYGGEHPDDAAGMEIRDGQAEAEEALQWFRSDQGSGIAVRTVILGAWRIVQMSAVAPDLSAGSCDGTAGCTSGELLRPPGGERP